jgi:hypothetical protein
MIIIGVDYHPEFQQLASVDTDAFWRILRVHVNESFLDSPSSLWHKYLNEVLTCMQGEKGQQWRVLCEQAAVEQDPQRLLELAEQINRLLDEKEQRLKQQHGDAQGAA